MLSAYTYDIVFKPTTLHCNADGMSRLPLPQNTSKGRSTRDLILARLQCYLSLLIKVQKATLSDPILSKVYRYTKNGWPSHVTEDLQPFWSRRNDLTVEGECVMLGIQVVIPQKLQDSVLQELHSTHPGIQRMKSQARGHVWWPGVDDDIENKVKSCTACLYCKFLFTSNSQYTHAQ